METTRMSRYTNEHDPSKNIHAFAPKTRHQHRSIYQHGVDNVLIAKSMLAYSNKMKQISQNRNLIPFLGARAYKDSPGDSRNKEPQKKLQPTKARHPNTKPTAFLQPSEPFDSAKLDGFRNNRPMSAQNRGVFSQTNNIFALQRRPASDPLMMLDNSLHPFNGYRRYGMDPNRDRISRLNGETNVLTFGGTHSPERRISVTSLSSGYTRVDPIRGGQVQIGISGLPTVLLAPFEDNVASASGSVVGDSTQRHPPEPAFDSSDEDDVSIPLENGGRAHGKDKDFISDGETFKRKDSNSSSQLEDLTDFLTRSTPIDQNVLRKPKQVPETKIGTELITVKVMMEGPQLYREFPLKVIGKHSTTFQSEPKAKNKPVLPAIKTKQDTKTVKRTIAKPVKQLDTKHKAVTKPAVTTAMPAETTDGKPKMNKSNPSVHTKPVPADKTDVKPKMKKNSDTDVKANQHKKLDADVHGKEGHSPRNDRSSPERPALFAEIANKHTTPEPKPEGKKSTSNLKEMPTNSPTSSESSSDILSPSEKEVQQAHLRLFGKNIHEAEVKKRLKKPKQTTIVAISEEVIDASDKDANTKEESFSNEQTDVPVSAKPNKKKKRVQFGEDMIREVTKIQYPWYFEDSPSEGDDDDDDDEDDDDEESDEAPYDAED